MKEIVAVKRMRETRTVSTSASGATTALKGRSSAEIFDVVIHVILHIDVVIVVIVVVAVVVAFAIVFVVVVVVADDVNVSMTRFRFRTR